MPEIEFDANKRCNVCKTIYHGQDMPHVLEDCVKILRYQVVNLTNEHSAQMRKIRESFEDLYLKLGVLNNDVRELRARRWWWYR